MSFFSGIDNWWKKTFGNSHWATTAQVAISLVGPPAILIVQQTLGTEDAAEGQQVLTEVQTDLATVVQLLKQAQTGDTTANGRITAVLQSLQENLATILADAHVKNSANAAKIEQMVGAFSAEITVILGLIPAAN